MPQRFRGRCKGAAPVGRRQRAGQSRIAQCARTPHCRAAHAEAAYRLAARPHLPDKVERASPTPRLPPAWSRAVRAELRSASSTSSTPEKTASAPRSQWKANSTNRKIGVHGASKKANGPGPEGETLHRL